MVVFATFPFENQTPEQAAADDWLIGVAPLILIFAIAIGGAVIARRVTLAVIASLAQFTVGAIVVAYALRESDHSDGKVVFCALAFAATAVAAVTATRVERH